MIVFLSDNGWMQGEHRIPGDKFLPYEESLRVPLVIRGPGVPEGPDGARPGLEHRLRPDAARPRERDGRADDGRRLAAADDPQPEAAARSGRSRSRRWRPLFGSADIPINAWDRPYTGVRTDRYTYVVWTETGEVELYDRKRRSRTSSQNRRRRSRPTPTIEAAPGGEARQARGLPGRRLQREAVIGRLALGGRPRRARGRGGRRSSRAPTRRAGPIDLHDARYCEVLELRGAIPDATRHRLEHDRRSTAARPPSGRRSMPARWRRSAAPRP